MDRNPWKTYLATTALACIALIIFFVFGPIAFLCTAVVFLFWIRTDLFRSLETFEKSLSIVLNISVTVFCLSTTIFLFSHINQYYFRSTATVSEPYNIVLATTSPPSIQASSANPVDNIDNQTLLAILSLIIVFAGLMSFIFLKIVRNNLHAETQSLLEDERAASRAEALMIASSVETSLYEFLKEFESNKNHPEKYIANALLIDKQALDAIKNVDQRKYRDLLLKLHNNYGYDIALKYKETKVIGKEDAIKLPRIRKDLREFIGRSSRKNYKDINDRHVDQFIDTLEKISDEFPERK